MVSAPKASVTIVCVKMVFATKFVGGLSYWYGVLRSALATRLGRSAPLGRRRGRGGFVLTSRIIGHGRNRLDFDPARALLERWTCVDGHSKLSLSIVVVVAFSIFS